MAFRSGPVKRRFVDFEDVWEGNEFKRVASIRSQTQEVRFFLLRDLLEWIDGPSNCRDSASRIARDTDRNDGRRLPCVLHALLLGEFAKECMAKHVRRDREPLDVFAMRVGLIRDSLQRVEELHA